MEGGARTDDVGIFTMNIIQKARAKRLIKLKETIMAAAREGKELSYKKTLAFLMMEFYLARRTAQEHINCLIDGGFCRRDGDIISVPESKILDDVFKP